MRLKLATTLKNYGASLNRDARMLNAVVETKGETSRAIKRPGLVATYEVTTPGAGLGLFVRNTPTAPGVGYPSGSPELVVIAGSVLTSSPDTYYSPSHSLVAVDLSSGIVLGMQGASGSITPTDVEGLTVMSLFNNITTNVVEFQLAGPNTQDYITSIRIDGITLLGADAIFTQPGGNSLWTWTNAEIIPAVGTYNVLIVPMI